MNHYVNIKINDRIEGDDRMRLYEAPLDAYLNRDNLGEILSIGTMINDEGEPEYFEIEVSLVQNDVPTLTRLVSFLESLHPPKGSYLIPLSDEDDLDRDDTHDTTESEFFEDEFDLDESDDNAIEFEYVEDAAQLDSHDVMAFGDLEGIAVYLDRVNLPDALFERYDLNELIADIEIALDIDEGGENEDLALRCFELDDYTALCFYGAHFAQMKQALSPLIQTHPLCKGAKLVRIA